ncbi:MULTISPECIES: LytR/AlgR family response regulator transcription factor [unclassified Chryseobacterium]|uniref:LytR/AlgR family response regulator transcription factor n=1 Tax=unclassified Chryseobacterium TaxID=2593645 RepID=UPI00301B5069
MIPEIKYNCLIIEDEPIAMEIMEHFISQNKDFHIVGKCSDAIYANSLLKIHQIDLIFLDLHLPAIKGFEFLKRLKNRPHVIVTTAFHEYALEGYELNIVDYLLKPISYTRFQDSIEKFKHLMNAEKAILEIEDRDFIFVNIAKRKIKIILQDIFYIESIREYIKIHTKQEVYTVKMPISKFEKDLDENNFIRIHKSYIVSRSKIEVMSASEITVNGKKLPIGRTYRPFISN